MTQSNEPTIEQKNEVIDLFMGGSSIKEHGDKRYVYYPKSCAKDVAELRYHTSWDWLMPVWVKWRHNVPISKEAEKWTDSLGYYLLTSDEPKRFFERLYYAITWYNQQTTTNE